MVGEFLNPLARTDQQYCFCYVFGSCHSKAKISCDSGANRMQKKASFKSNTEYQVLANVEWPAGCRNPGPLDVDPQWLH